MVVIDVSVAYIFHATAPNIELTEQIVEDISFAKSSTDIHEHKTRPIKHSRKSLLLFHSNIAWKKKTTTKFF